MDSLAHFRFFYSLNDFLSKENKNTSIPYPFNGSPSVKDAIEALGVPHPEVDRIMTNQGFVDFNYLLQNNDELEVYTLPDISARAANSLTPEPVYPLSFVADVHAGKLAKTLRMLGIDTRYDNQIADSDVARIAEEENLVVLTRDIGLLKHRKIKWGYWLRSQQTNQQLFEVVNRFKLRPFFKPFTICMECNGTIKEIDKDEVLQLLPAKTAQYFNEFYQCTDCHRTYWKGSHYENMITKIGAMLETLVI